MTCTTCHMTGQYILSRAGNRGSTQVRFADSLAERYPATIRRKKIRYPVTIRPSEFVFSNPFETGRCSKMHTGAHFPPQTDSQGNVKQTIWLQTSSENRLVWHSCGRVLGPSWAGPPFWKSLISVNCLSKLRFRRSCCRAFGRRPPWSFIDFAAETIR